MTDWSTDTWDNVLCRSSLACSPADSASVTISTVSNVYDWPERPNGGSPHALEAPLSFEELGRSPHPGCCKDAAFAHILTRGSNCDLALRWLARPERVEVAHIASTRNVARCWQVVEGWRDAVVISIDTYTRDREIRLEWGLARAGCLPSFLREQLQYK